MLVLNSNNSNTFKNGVVNSDFSLFGDLSNVRVLGCLNGYAETGTETTDTAPSIATPILSVPMVYSPTFPYCYEKDTVSGGEMAFRVRTKNTNSITTSENGDRFFIAGSCGDKANFSFKGGEKVGEKIDYNIFIAAALYFNNSGTNRTTRGGYELKVGILHTDNTKTFFGTKTGTFTGGTTTQGYNYANDILVGSLLGDGIIAENGDTLIREIYVWYKGYTDNRSGTTYEGEIVVSQGYYCGPAILSKEINTPAYWSGYSAKYNRGPAPIIVSVY